MQFYLRRRERVSRRHCVVVELNPTTFSLCIFYSIKQTIVNSICTAIISNSIEQRAVAIAELRSKLFLNSRLDGLERNVTRALNTSCNMLKDRVATAGLFTLSNECHNIFHFRTCVCSLDSPCFSPGRTSRSVKLHRDTRRTESRNLSFSIARGQLLSRSIALQDLGL